MQKIFFLIFLPIIFLGCSQNISTSTDDNSKTVLENEQTEKMDTFNDWETYSDQELGLSFKYPQGEELNIYSQAPDDIGEKKVFSSESFSMVITSSDYAEGVGEGCCFYFSGPPFNIERSLNEITLDLEKTFGALSQVSIVSFGEGENDKAIFFVRKNNYISSSRIPSYLIPFDHTPYANILLSGKEITSGEGINEKEKLNFLLRGIEFPE